MEQVDGTKPVKARVLSTFPVMIYNNDEYVSTFISFVNLIDDPRLTSLKFSLDGSVNNKDCLTIPISSRLQVTTAYPQIILYDGFHKAYFQFDSTRVCSSFLKMLTTKLADVARYGISDDSIYHTFLDEPLASQRIKQLPPYDTDQVFRKIMHTTDGKIEDPVIIAMMMIDERSFRTYNDVEIHIVTYNIDQKPPPENLKLLFGDESKQFDIYVICCQEIDMSVDGIMTGSSPNKKIWDKAVTEYAQYHGNYIFVNGFQLGTSYIAVLARNQDRIKYSASTSVSIGAMGFYNKTAVAVSVGYKDTNFCFICSHLSAGRSNLDRRNSEFWYIQSHIKFKTPDGPMTIDDHDYIFWCGDFNYRIALTDPESRSKFHDVEYLLRHDQLLQCHAQNKTFVGYSEGPIKFKPTYKFDKGTETLDTSSKQRGPAWCDRVYYRCNADESFLKQTKYDSIKGMLMSDHHPVEADFVCRCWTNDHEKAAISYRNNKIKVENNKWKMSVDKDSIDVGLIKLGEPKTFKIILRNEGLVATPYFIQTEVPWITCTPKRSVCNPGKVVELVFIIHVTIKTLEESPMTSPDIVKLVTIKFPSGRPNIYLTFTGKYQLTYIGIPVKFLYSLPAPISKLPPAIFVPRRECDLTSCELEMFPMQKHAYELESLIGRIKEVITDANIMSETPAEEEVYAVIEALRNREKIPENASQYALMAVLKAIFECSPEPLLTKKLLSDIEKEESAAVAMANIPDPAKSIIKLLLLFFTEMARRTQNADEDRAIHLLSGMITKYDDKKVPVAEKFFKAFNFFVSKQQNPQN